MKNCFLLLAICVYNLGFASPIQEYKIDSNALSQLASALDIPQNADIITETQKHWLRKAGQERWELSELSLKQRLVVLDWAEEQGLFAARGPALEVYDKALILGATTPCMRMRLNYLKKLWLQGTRFNEIVWLTGDRPLDKRVDDLIDRCSNESEAAHILWQEADLPKEMHNLPVVFVAVPMKTKAISIVRPNTADTIIAWLKIASRPCKALFVSNQPFCGYQFAVIKACLPESYQFDVVGQGVDLASGDSANIAVVTLDSIARWIYLEDLHKSRMQ